MFYLLVDTSINVLAVVFVVLDDVNQSVIIMAKIKPPVSRPKTKPWRHGDIDEGYLKMKHYCLNYLTLSLSIPLLFIIGWIFIDNMIKRMNFTRSTIILAAFLKCMLLMLRITNMFSWPNTYLRICWSQVRHNYSSYNNLEEKKNV